MYSYQRLGLETTINSASIGDQIYPAVAGFDTGGFVVVWQSSYSTQDGSGYSINLQRYDADGRQIGGEVLVNSALAGDQRYADVTTLANGSFIVTWETSDATQDGSGTAVKAQMFAADGSLLGGEFRLNTQTSLNQTHPTIAALDTGGFVVTWQTSDATQDGFGTAVKAQIYDAAGHAVGSEFLVNKTAFGQESLPDITGLDGGGFVATWTTNSGSGTDIYARIFTATGTPAGEQFLVNTLTSFNQDTAAVSELSGGRFIVTWASQMSSQSGDVAIRAQIFSSTGQPIGSEFQVSTTTGGSTPHVQDLPTGGFVITWSNISGTAESTSVVAREFDSSGAPLGPETIVNTVTNRYEGHGDVAVDGNGTILSVWESLSLSGSTDFQIEGQFLSLHQGPAITSNGAGDAAAVTINENQAALTTVVASNPNGATLSYAIVGGTDASMFTIDAATGKLSFRSAPDYEAKADSNGDNVYNVVVSAGDGTYYDLQSLAVTVANVNEAPYFNSTPSSVTYAENGTAQVQIFNAFDPDLTKPTYSLTGLDADDFTIDSFGYLRFASSPNFERPTDSDGNNIYQVTVVASDGSLSASRSITVTVTNVNEAPSISSNGGGDTAAIAVAENQKAVTTVQAVDPDSGATVTYSITGGADAALFTINASTGALSFANAPNFEAPVDADRNNVYDVVVRASDGTLSDTQSIALTVANVNEAPALTGAQTALAHATEDVDYTITSAQLLAGYTDVDGDALSVTGLTADHGTVTANPDGSYTITQAANFNGNVTLSYSVTDGRGGSATASIGYTVDPVNDAPAIVSAVAQLPNGTEDLAYSVSRAQLLAGYADPDGDTLAVASLSANHGTVVANGDGTYTITQAPNFNGSVTLSYEVVDGNGGSVSASLGYAVNAVNDAPALTGPQATLANGTEDVSYMISAPQLLSGFTDVDGDALTIANLVADHGTVSSNGDGTYTITQAANFNGSVELKYEVVDGTGAKVIGKLGYTLNSVNDAPALTGQQAALANGTEDVSYTVSATQLLSGFTDVDGDALTIANLAADHGSVSSNGDGTYTVTQAANFNGRVTLTYSVEDSNGGSVAASLGYQVTAVNDAPVLTSAPATLAHGSEDMAYSVGLAQLLAGYTDADGDFLSIAGLSADHGSVIANADGTYTIAPPTDYNGVIALSYNVVDGQGGITAASLSYVVDAVNDAPQLIGAPATLPNGTEDVAYTVAAGQLTSGFIDAERDQLSIANLSADHGTVTDNGNGTYTITQSANFNGQVKLSYTVVDGNGGGNPAQLYYLITAVNDAPIGSVTISGLAATGQQLTALNTLADADGLGAVTYQWLLDGSAIAGATGFSYAVKASDLGHVVSVVASYTDGGGTAERVTSAPTGAIVLGPGTFTGTSGADTLSGSNYDDLLIGQAGNDTLRGLAGNDVLRGGAGNDILDGGAGTDTADYSDATAAVKVSLAVTTAQNTGGSGSDTLTGIENLLGSAYGDTLTGDGGANRLNGGGGADALAGGAGVDTFVFDVLTTSANKDTIKDFGAGVDKIELATSAFSALAGYGLGQMDTSELVLGTAATSATQHLIYDPKTGNLMYDADGSGSGAAITIAVLTGHPAIHASDIFLI